MSWLPLSVGERRFVAVTAWPLTLLVALVAVLTAISGPRAVAAASGAGLLIGLLTARLVRPDVGVRVAQLLARPAVGLALVAALTFGLRALFGLQVLATHGPGLPFAVVSDDGDNYLRRTLAVLEDPANVLGVLADAVWAPGYPLFLAGVLGATGRNWVVVILAQALIAALASALVYRLASDVAGPYAALVAGVLFALDQNLVTMQTTLTAEALLIPFLLLFVWALRRASLEGGRRWLAAAGIAMALAISVRDVAVVFLLAGLAWLLFRERRAGGWRALGRAAVPVAISLVAILPTVYATWVVTGAPRATHQDASLNWRLTNGPWEEIAPSNVALAERGFDPFARPGESFRLLITDPGSVLGFILSAAPRRALTVLFHPNFGVSDPLTVLNGGVVPNPYALAIFSVLFVSMLAGVVVAMRGARDGGAVGSLCVAAVLGYVLLFSVVFAPLHPVRYRTPIEPFLVVFQGIGLALIAEQLFIARGLARLRAFAASALRLHGRVLARGG